MIFQQPFLQRRVSCQGLEEEEEEEAWCGKAGLLSPWAAERHLALARRLKNRWGGSAGSDALGHDPSQRNKTHFREMRQRVISSQ